MTDEPAYGLWSLVVINSLVFIIFAFSFSKPRTARDWRSFSAFSAFIVALFVEVYGFPLPIYLISGWLVNRYSGVDVFSHDAGHLWNTLLGWNNELPRSKLRGIRSNRSNNRSELRGIRPREIKSSGRGLTVHAGRSGGSSLED